MDDPHEWFLSGITHRENLVYERKCVDPDIAQKAWLKICPCFFTFAISGDKEEYWEQIYNRVKEFHPTADVQNPLTDFNSFITFVFNNRNLYTPKNVKSCVTTISTLKYNNLLSFVTHVVPIIFNNPSLFVQTLHELKLDGHKLWFEITGNLSISSTLISTALNFLSSSKRSQTKKGWIFKIQVASILLDLLYSGARKPSHLSKTSIDFLDKILVLLRYANIEASAELLRIALSLLTHIAPKQMKYQMPHRYSLLLQNLDSHQSDLFYTAAKCMLNMNNQFSQSQKIFEIILERGVRNIQDFILLEAISKDVGCEKVLNFAARTAINSKVWHRAAMNLFKNIVIQNQTREETKEWVSLYVRKMFVFIILSSIKRKYAGRSLAFCESLSMLNNTRIIWLQAAISINASSAYSTRQYPSFFKNFFQNKTAPTLNFQTEVEAFAADQNLNLKIFPFDESRTGFVAQPPLDLSSKSSRSVSSVSISKATRHSSTNDIKLIKSSLELKELSLLPQIPKKEPKKVYIKKNFPPVKPGTRPLACALYVTPINRR